MCCLTQLPLLSIIRNMKLKIRIVVAAVAGVLMSCTLLAEPYNGAGFLEYITTSGNGATGQRINLDYVPTGNTIVRAKFSPKAIGKNQCLYCARVKAAASADAKNYNYFAMVSNKARFDYYDK